MRRGADRALIAAILGITPVLLLVATGERAFAQQEAHRQAIDTAYRNWVDVTNAKD